MRIDMSNYKLKHAVTAAIGLIAIGFQSSSFAIGLGDIQVQSHYSEKSLMATLR